MSDRHHTVMPDTWTTSGYSSFNDHERQMFLVPLCRWQLGTAAICLPSCSQGIASFAFNSYNPLSFPPHLNLKQPLPWLSGIYNLSFILSQTFHTYKQCTVSHTAESIELTQYTANTYGMLASSLVCPWDSNTVPHNLRWLLFSCPNFD